MQNNMACVKHGYLLCGHVGEVHLIFSAILAANLLAIHLGSVPIGCEETRGTALEAKNNTKRTESRREATKGTRAPIHPVEQSHTCLLFDLEHDERIVLERGRVPPAPQAPPFGKPLLVAVREEGCGQKERAVAQKA